MSELVGQPTFRDYAGILEARYAGDRNFVYPDVGLLRGILSGRAAYLKRGQARPLAVSAGGSSRAFGVAFVDPGLQKKTGQATGSIGFFEALDESSARAVLDAGCEWLADHGVEEVWAPFNGNPYYQMGAREDRFDEPPFIGCAHSPESTRQFLTAAGFELVNRYLNFEVDLSARPWEGFTTPAGFELRPASRRRFRTEVLSYIHLHNAAFRTVWGEVEISDAEGLQILMRSRLAINPQLFRFATRGGADLGFVLCMPDLNSALAPLHVPLTSPRGVLRLTQARGRARSVGLLSLGVDPDQQGAGLGTALVAAACRAAADLGFARLEYALVAENNEPSRATAARFGGRLCRTFGIYGRRLR
jgi:GNAT superfamily N-acetyltransferase